MMRKDSASYQNITCFLGVNQSGIHRSPKNGQSCFLIPVFTRYATRSDRTASVWNEWFDGTEDADWDSFSQSAGDLHRIPRGPYVATAWVRGPSERPSRDGVLAGPRSQGGRT